MATVRCVMATGGETCRGGEVAVAVDVLRASTTITVALELGAEAVLVTREIEQARDWASARGALLMGERGNTIVPGFDFGNSPVALREKAEMLGGRTIVFTSSNFPRATAACEPASHAFVGCLLNLGAVCEHAAARGGSSRDVCIVLAGNLETSADEDLAFAGACATRLVGMGFDLDPSIVEALRSVQARGVEACVHGAPHAAALIRQGYGDDVRLAAQVDRTRTVGVLEGERIRAAPGAPGRSH